MVDEYMQKGALVPDDVMLKMLAAAVAGSSKDYILLDGYPRTTP